VGYYSYDNQADRCEHCGKQLEERQERYCSHACRQGAYRTRKRPRKRPQLKRCPLCGEGFEVTHPRKKYCDYNDEAEEDCRTAQDDLDEAAELAAMERAEAECAHCGNPAGWTGRGRPRRYCSNRCKTAAYRNRKRAAQTP
jgi:endogenous inhibitor of DNA gyrase (YacG/DUF329 family)